MNTFIILMVLVVFVEAVTEIFVSSDIFARFRDYIGQRNTLLGELIHCGYCTSVWVSASVAWLIPLNIGVEVLSYIIATFVLHRLSNLFHELTCKWMNRTPLAMMIHKTESVLLPDLGDNYEANEETNES